MSKNKQILIFSGIGLLVLGGVTALLLLTAPAEDKPAADDTVIEEVDERLILTEKKTDDITKIHVKNSSGEYNIVPKSDGGWTVEGIESANIMETSLSTLAKNVAEMTATAFVEENAADLGKYGLTAPQSTVTVQFSDGEFSFAVGNDAPASSTDVYLSAGSTVYTYKKSALSAFSGDKFSFIDRTAVPAYDQSTGEEVKRLTIERIDLDEPIIVEQIPTPEEGDIAVFSYELKSPYTAYVDLTNAPNLIYSLYGLTARSVAWYGMEEKDYEISGLNEPNFVITVESSVKTYTVTLGKALAEEVTDENGNVTTEIVGFYGMSSEVPDTLFVFNTNDLPTVSVSAEELISRLFLMPYIYSVDTVEYSDEKGNSFTLGFEKLAGAAEDGSDICNHYLNGEPYDEQQIKDMYQYLISASGDEAYFLEEKGELLATVVYNYKDTSQGSDTVKFYSSETDRSVIINVNGKNLFKTKQAYMNQLYLNVENFLNGGEIVLTY